MGKVLNQLHRLHGINVRDILESADGYTCGTQVLKTTDEINDGNGRAQHFLGPLIVKHTFKDDIDGNVLEDLRRVAGCCIKVACCLKVLLIAQCQLGAQFGIDRIFGQCQRKRAMVFLVGLLIRTNRLGIESAQSSFMAWIVLRREKEKGET